MGITSDPAISANLHKNRLIQRLPIIRVIGNGACASALKTPTLSIELRVDSEWTVSSLASVLAIQSVTGIATLGDPLTRLEKSLAGLIEAGVELERAGQRSAFTALVASRVNKGRINSMFPAI